MTFGANRALLAPAVIPAGRTAVQAEQFFQPSPEAALGLASAPASAGFVTETAPAAAVAMVAPTPALMGAATRAAALV